MKYNEYWKNNSGYGNLFSERATGLKEEMESSKALCEVLKPIYRPNMKVLDVGCGAGHYLRSLKERLDTNINYTGIDITEFYIEKAKQAFKNVSFFIDDIYNMCFRDNSFNIVTCNNVIMHLPVPPTKAISELLRVSSDYVVIRTPVSKRNYIIREVRGKEDSLDDNVLNSLPKSEYSLINEEGEPIVWNYLNLYTKRYLEELILNINPDYVVTFIDDKWVDLTSKADSKTATKCIDGRQVSGNIILDYKFIIIRK